MPQKITTVRYACPVCERKHIRKEAAEKCERKGIAVPEFHHLEVAEYVGEDAKLRGKKVIVKGNAHRVYLKPTYIHKLPSLYEVYVGKGLGWYARVRYFELRKVTDFNGGGCPLCGSTEVFDSTRENYQVFTSLFPRKLPQLSTVACKECPVCQWKFFTSEQLAEVERRIKLSLNPQGY